MKDLCRRFLEEVEAGAGSLAELSDQLREEIEERVSAAILRQGFKAIKSYLEAF